MNDAEERARVGLCADCRFVRRLESAKGSTFYRCGKARRDPRFRDYPPLPVLRCPGHERDGKQPDASEAEPDAG